MYFRVKRTGSYAYLQIVESYREYLKVLKGDRFAIDQAKVKAEARYDGKWVLRTNLDLDAEVVAGAYKRLWMVENLFRTMKSILETRPIFHKCDETIRGHVFCSFLALLLKRALEQRLEAQDQTWENLGVGGDPAWSGQSAGSRSMRLLKWQLVVTLASQGSLENSLSGKSYGCDLPHL